MLFLKAENDNICPVFTATQLENTFPLLFPIWWKSSDISKLNIRVVISAIDSLCALFGSSPYETETTKNNFSKDRIDKSTEFEFETTHHILLL